MNEGMNEWLVEECVCERTNMVLHWPWPKGKLFFQGVNNNKQHLTFWHAHNGRSCYNEPTNINAKAKRKSEREQEQFKRKCVPRRKLCSELYNAAMVFDFAPCRRHS